MIVLTLGGSSGAAEPNDRARRMLRSEGGAPGMNDVTHRTANGHGEHDASTLEERVRAMADDVRRLKRGVDQLLSRNTPRGGTDTDSGDDTA